MAKRAGTKGCNSTVRGAVKTRQQCEDSIAAAKAAAQNPPATPSMASQTMYRHTCYLYDSIDRQRGHGLPTGGPTGGGQSNHSPSSTRPWNRPQQVPHLGLSIRGYLLWSVVKCSLPRFWLSLPAQRWSASLGPRHSNPTAAHTGSLLLDMNGPDWSGFIRVPLWSLRSTKPLVAISNRAPLPVPVEIY